MMYMFIKIEMFIYCNKMPTYRIQTPIKLIQSLQTNKQLRDQYQSNTIEWKYYDDLFSKDIESLSSLFKKENEVVEMKKFSCK